MTLLISQLNALLHVACVVFILNKKQDILKQKQYQLLITQSIGSIICIESMVFELDATLAFGYSLIFTAMFVRIYRIWKVFEYSHRNVFNLQVWKWYVQLLLANLPVFVYIAFNMPQLDKVIYYCPAFVGLTSMLFNARSIVIWKKLPDEDTIRYRKMYDEHYYLLCTIIYMGIIEIPFPGSSLKYIPFMIMPVFMTTFKQRVDVEPVNNTTFVRRASAISGLTSDNAEDSTFTVTTLTTSWSTETLPVYNEMN